MLNSKLISTLSISVFVGSFLTAAFLFGVPQNLIPNPSFEFGGCGNHAPTGWTYQQNFVSPLSRGNAAGAWEKTPYLGNRSISITEERWFSASQWGCLVKRVEPETFYLLSLQVKRDTDTGWLPKVRVFDQSRVVNVKKPGSWQYFEFLFCSGQTSGSTELSLIVYKKPSKIWFDDLKLTKFTIEPLTPFRNEKVTCPEPRFSWKTPQNSQAINYQLQISPDNPEDPVYLRKGITENSFCVPDLSPGQYSWKVKAFCGSRLLAESRSQSFKVVAGPSTLLNSDCSGRIHATFCLRRESTPTFVSPADKFFPLAISGLPPERIAEAKKSGFNWVFAPGNPHQYRADGWKIISSSSDPMPDIYYLYDEPEQYGVLPRTVREKDFLFKKLNPEIPSAVTVYDLDRYLEYAGTADILMVDPYPIPVRPLESVAQAVLAAREVRGEEPVWAIIQAFDWKEFSAEAAREGLGRLPSSPEMRAMAYLAIAAGAKGLVFYTGGQPKVYQSGLFSELKKLARELKSRNDFLSAPAIKNWTEPPFYLLEKEIPGKKGTYLLIVNSESVPARFGKELIEAYGVRLRRVSPLMP